MTGAEGTERISEHRAFEITPWNTTYPPTLQIEVSHRDILNRYGLLQAWWDSGHRGKELNPPRRGTGFRGLPVGSREPFLACYSSARVSPGNMNPMG